MSNPKRNAAGYVDPTTYEAVKNTTDDDKIDREAKRVRAVLASKAISYGFAMTGCKLVHFETGRRYSL